MVFVQCDMRSLVRLRVCLAAACCLVFSSDLIAKNDVTKVENTKDLITEDVISSPSDSRHFRYLILTNQMRVLLVSDATSAKAAVAVDFAGGSNADPQDFPGIAHLLEHTIFQGSEHYPEAVSYFGFIRQNDGSFRASTAEDYTSFYADIDADYFDELLARMADTFRTADLSSPAIERALQVADIELQYRQRDDELRVSTVYQQLLRPQQGGIHAASDSTIKLSAIPVERLQNELADYYRHNYVPDLMTLVTLGPQSLDELQALVETHFANLTNDPSDDISDGVSLVINKSPSSQADSPGEQTLPSISAISLFTQTNDDQSNEVLSGNALLDKSVSPQPSSVVMPAAASSIKALQPIALPASVTIQSDTQQPYLELLFPIDILDSHRNVKPVEYISNLLGDAGPGSLQSLLKSQGLAEDLSVRVKLEEKDNAVLSLKINVTEQGAQQQDTIIALTFYAIDQITKHGVEYWRHRELDALTQLDYRFPPNTSAIYTVSHLANNLRSVAPQDVLRSDYLMDRYDSQVILQVLSRLTATNVLIATVSPDLQTDKVSEQLSVPFTVESYVKSLIAIAPELKGQLKLPEPNNFIPQKFTLKPQADENSPIALKPQLIKNAARIKVWHLQDQLFKTPLVSANLRIDLPASTESSQQAALTWLYVAAINDVLTEQTWSAGLAGIHYSLTPHRRGIDIWLQGYDDGLDRLLQRLVSELQSPRFSRTRFATIKEKLINNWQAEKERPLYTQLLNDVSLLLAEPNWFPEALATEASTITFDDLNGFAKNAFADGRAELLFYGNITRSEAAKLAGLVEVELLNSMAGRSLSPIRILQLNPVAASDFVPGFEQSVEGEQSAAVLYLQGRDDSLEEQARFMLLRSVLDRPFAILLQSESSQGGFSFVVPMTMRRVPGAAFVVQSEMATTAQLVDYVDSFIRAFIARPQNDLSEYKRVLIAQLLKRPSNLQEQAGIYWTDIVNDADNFNRRQQLAANLEIITAESFARYSEEILESQSRKLWLLAGSKPIGAESGIAPITDWRSIMQTQPSYRYP